MCLCVGGGDGDITVLYILTYATLIWKSATRDDHQPGVHTHLSVIGNFLVDTLREWCCAWHRLWVAVTRCVRANISLKGQKDGPSKQQPGKRDRDK